MASLNSKNYEGEDEINKKNESNNRDFYYTDKNKNNNEKYYDNQNQFNNFNRKSLGNDYKNSKMIMKEENKNDFVNSLPTIKKFKDNK